MTLDEAEGFADQLAWDQTKALLGPVPWHGDPVNPVDFDYWIGKRDELRAQIMAELQSSGIIEPSEDD